MRRVHLAPEIRRYAVDLVSATRRLPELRLGASPRATLHLVRAARAQAALSGRDFVVPDDVQAVAIPVLAHRLVLSSEAQAARRSPPNWSGACYSGYRSRCRTPPTRASAEQPRDRLSLGRSSCAEPWLG